MSDQQAKDELIKPVGQDEYSDDWIASAWGESSNEALLQGGDVTPRPRVARALELCDVQPGSKILDIACGRGEVPAIVSRQGAYGVGLDYAESSIEFAARVQAANTDKHHGRMTLVHGDACQLPFDSEIFDRVTMLDIVEHLYPEQLQQMFREVYRVLAPEGYAIIHTLPNRWVYDVTYPVVHSLWRKVPKDPRNPFERKIHINEQDILKLHSLLKQLGLKHRIWLEQHIPAQARWSKGVDKFSDNRENVYPLLSGIAGRALELLSMTPCKLLLCNDIYGVIWKESKSLSNTKLPLALTERLTCAIVPNQ